MIAGRKTKLTAMAFLAIIELFGLVRLQMIQVFWVVTRPMTRVHCDAISGKRGRDLKESFGSEMKIMSADAGD